MPTQEQINAALKAGYTQEQIKLALARSGAPKKQSILSKVGEFGMDVLNTPSYAVGGALRGLREGGYTGGIKGGFSGLKEGFTTQGGPTVYRELPKTLGLKEGGLASTLVGLGGELLTPNIPVAGLLGKAGKALKIGSKLGKAGGIAQDAGRVLLEKSYKLSASDIEKIADAIGASDPATKSMKVIDYLEGLKLGGSTRGSLQKLGGLITQKKSAFDKVARRGGQVSRQPFVSNLLDEAIKAEKMDTPQSRLLSQKLFNEALQQERMTGKPLMDTELSDKISRLFSEAGESAISDPTSANLAKRMAVAGQGAREVLRPGSTALGRDLRGLMTAQEVIGKKANTGLGTQLVNAFKPSALGFGVGATVGASRGENPITGGLMGAAIGIGANNPRLMNVAGKALTGKLPSIGVSSAVTSAAGRSFDTAIRAPKFTQPTPELRQPVRSEQKSQTSPSIVAPKASEMSKPLVVTKAIKYSLPKNTFKNKTTFGRQFKLKPGSFN